MPQARDTRRTRAAKTAPITPFELPPLPPKTEAEMAEERNLRTRMQELVAELQQRNLDNAVLLAQQAAAGRGPLVDHFKELGRRYSTLLETPQRPALRLVKGGDAA